MQHYIFNTSIEIEKHRLDILNNACNENTKEILSQYIKPKMSVLEVGFGEGQISDYINSIEDIKYIGIDSDVGRVAKRYEEGKYMFGDLLKLDNVKALKRKKFDVIYMRWILAYLPQYTLKTVLINLHSMLKRNGVLILEECDLYKAYLEKECKKIKIPVFENWIALSRLVQTMINSCNFRMGSELPDILDDTFVKKTEVKKFQPVLQGADKRIITLGLRSSSVNLTERKIITLDEINEMINNIEYSIVENDDVKLHYVETTTCIVNK